MRVQFGEFALDRTTRQLLRGEEEVHLEPKAFELLDLLLQRRPQAVAKPEIRDRLWPGTFVSESNLTGLVAQVRDALGDDRRQSKYIRTVHGFGYAFSGDAAEPAPLKELDQIEEDSPSGLAATQRAPRSRLPWLGAGLAIVLVVIVAAVLWRRPRDVPTNPPRLEPLTSMRGGEEGASFSPDGEQVAFTWNGEKQDNFDIYVKLVGSSEMHRLTTDPAIDIMPAWSPDGKQIAFVRIAGGELRVHLISPVGGSDRKLSDFALGFATPSWSPDSRWLAVSRDRGLYLLPVNGGEPRALRIPQETGNAYHPLFSPDGRHLAYVSGVGLSSFVAIVDLGPDYVPTGAPRRITRGRFWGDGGLAWARDGKSLLYSEWGIHRLLRLDITGDGAAQPLEIAGLGAIRPAAAATRDRLLFVKEQTDRDIYRFEVGHPPEPAIASSFVDEGPQYSPDGRWVAFASQRSGEMEIWRAEPDGSSPIQLTHKPGRWQGTPRWSPDGRRIAFDSQGENGRWDIWTMDADGGSPRRLTQDPGDENIPSWSRDGRFIYFAAQSGGPVAAGFDVWRVPVAGGAEERITHGGGGSAYESIDGKTLFYMKNLNLEAAPLFALPLTGGPEREIAKCVCGFAVGAAGVYSLDCTDGPQTPLSLRDPLTGRGRLLGSLDRAESSRLTVSPDGKTILYVKFVGEGSDLMMIENFR